MKALVLGGNGKIGSAVAWDLVRQKEFDKVGLVGRNKESLRETAKWLKSDKVETYSVDMTNKNDVVELMKKFDVGVITLPDRRSDYLAVEAAIEAELDIVDVLEEYHRRPDEYETEGLIIPSGKTIEEYGEWLHNQFVKRGITFVDGIGFAPGISNVTVGEGIRKLDKVYSAIARVGGIPQKNFKDKHPLKYMITWAFEHVLREYMVKVNIRKDGKVKLVSAMDEYEEFVFNEFGKNEELECFITPGMPSFIYTRKDLRDFAEKTIRWRGHKQGIDTLKEVGMLDLEPVEFGGKKIVPREFLSYILTPKLLPSKDEGDVCVMWNTVVGEKEGRKTEINYYMWEELDQKTGISAMRRTTAFPAAIAAKFLSLGYIKEKGIVAPEDCFDSQRYGEFIKELEKRDITILERIS